MYKLTFYDECCNAICDGVESFYVEDLDEFESHWLLLVEDEDKIKRYFESKSGKLVTDYYSTSEDINIVQKDDNYKLLEEKSFVEKDIDVQLYNAFDCVSKHHLNNFSYRLRKVLYQGEYLIICKYKIKGIYRYYETYDRYSDNVFKYSQEMFFGNPIAECKFKELKGMDKKYPEEECIYSNLPSNYKDDTIETFVWLLVKRCEKDTELVKLTSEDLIYILRDIPGEGG